MHLPSIRFSPGKEEPGALSLGQPRATAVQDPGGRGGPDRGRSGGLGGVHLLLPQAGERKKERSTAEGREITQLDFPWLWH